MPLRKWFCDGR